MMKRFLNSRQIIENIGVIKFNIINNGRSRVIMNKLGTFIKESAVVFVGFNHKKR